MPVTGTTFNFNKTVTEEEPASTPDHPTDNAKIDTKIAGEKKGYSNVKDFINISTVMSTVKSAVNSALQNVEGSRLSEQISAMQSIASTTISSVFMAATNPFALLATMAIQGVNYALKMGEYSRSKAWQDYDLEEYNQRRGIFSSAANRSRNN